MSSALSVGIGLRLGVFGCAVPKLHSKSLTSSRRREYEDPESARSAHLSYLLHPLPRPSLG